MNDTVPLGFSSWADYLNHCKIMKQTVCEAQPGTDGHDWRAMSREEAHPASAGKACQRCHTTRMEW